MTNEFKKEGDDIIFVGKYMEIYIPEFYFEKDIAELVGDHFKTFGLLNFRTFADIDGTKPYKIRTFNLPVELYTYPSGGYEVKNLDLIGKGEEKYYVAKYYNTDKLCSAKLVAAKMSFRSFLEILMAGKLPGTLPYNSVMDIWQKNFMLTDVNFDIPDVIKEIVLSQIYRSKKDINVPFAKVIGKDPKTNPYDYVTASPRQITKLSSTYSGIAFEDFNQMVASGINNTKTNKKEVPSPMEPILKA